MKYIVKYIKHWIWGGVVLTVALLAAYLTLVLTGHEQAAQQFGSAIGTLLVIGFIAWVAIG